MSAIAPFKWIGQTLVRFQMDGKADDCKKILYNYGQRPRKK